VSKQYKKKLMSICFRQFNRSAKFPEPSVFLYMRLMTEALPEVAGKRCGVNGEKAWLNGR
jgi:hypothetical protein